MKLRQIILCMFFASCFASISNAADKWRVAVNHDGTDNVGAKLAFALREAIRSSHGYELTDVGTFTIVLVTLDPDAGTNLADHSTTASVTYTMIDLNVKTVSDLPRAHQIYLSSTIIVAGSNKTSSVASGLLARLDKLIDDVNKGVQY